MKRTKDKRIYIRVNDGEKALLEQAAKFQKKSLSRYIMLTVLNQAEKDIRKKEKEIALSGKSAKIMSDLLINPPEANDVLKKLLEKEDK